MRAIARMRLRSSSEAGATRGRDIPVERSIYTNTNSTWNVSYSTSPSSSTTHQPPPISQTQEHTSHRRPLVYPALLSRVADAFRQRIPLSSHSKDGQTYPASFTGREAVELISYIIKTSNRNLALLLGNALSAQGFFHNVDYKDRMSDSDQDIYRLSGSHPATPSKIKGGEAKESTPADEHDAPLPVGVFTLLTGCYAPTCKKTGMCYCCSCPKRVDHVIRQQPQRLVVTNPSPIPETVASIEDTPNNAQMPQGHSNKGCLIDRRLKEPSQLWIQVAPRGIVDSVSIQERKRQEAINEIIYTERNFVRDLEYLRNRWMEPLRARNVIPSDRRGSFVQEVFWNIEDILSVNTRLRDLLTKRQSSHPVIETIGDIFLEFVPHFQPFVQYGEHQLNGKYAFEKERSTNPAFAAFVVATERLPESRKLELNVYLTRPITHLAQYLLMLEVVLKHTPEDNTDRVVIPEVVKMIRELLAKANEERGRAENKLKLLQLNRVLVFKPGEEVDLRLKDEQRRLVHHGSLEYRGRNINSNGPLHVFLLDHVLLILKGKVVKKQEQLEVFMRPIPLELLVVSTLDDDWGQNIKPRAWFFRRSYDRRASIDTSPPVSPTLPDSQKNGYQLRVWCLGRSGYILTLWAPTAAGRDKWLEKITAQQKAIRDRSRVFNTHALNAGVFLDEAKVNCAVSYDQGRRVVYGTDNGVYFQSLCGNRTGIPEKRLSLADVRQVDVLEDHQILIVLSGREVLTTPLGALEVEEQHPITCVRPVTSDTSLFKIGHCLGRALVCAVKAGQLGGMVTVLEPIIQSIHGEDQPAPGKHPQGKGIILKVFKQFYMPNQVYSIDFLKTALCVACTTGFEIVDLESLDTHALLNPADMSLDFQQRFGDMLPVVAYQINGEFLLCYSKLAFYANKGGWWSKKNVVIRWEGNPTTFALHYPYVLAFEPTFIEVRRVEDGAFVQIIPGNNLQLLYAGTQSSMKNSNSAHPNTRSSVNIILASDEKLLAVRLVPPPSRMPNETATSREWGTADYH